MAYAWRNQQVTARLWCHASRSLLDSGAMPVAIADHHTSLLCRVHGSKGRAQLNQQEERSATPEARQTRARKAQETAEAERQQQPRRTGRTSTAAKAEPGGSSSRGKPGHSSTQDEGSKEHSKEGPNGLPKLRKVKKVGLEPVACLVSPVHVPSPNELEPQLVRPQQAGLQTACQLASLQWLHAASVMTNRCRAGGPA